MNPIIIYFLGVASPIVGTIGYILIRLVWEDIQYKKRCKRTQSKK